jgi:transposase
LRDIARIAYTEGMTAHEAAEKFGVNVLSVRKVVCKHKMPRLLTAQDKHIMRQLKNMNDTQLLSYSNALSLPKNNSVGKAERLHVQKELELRNLKA